MAIKKATTARARSTSSGKPKKAKALKRKKKAVLIVDPSSRRFVRDLLIRGEAVKPTADGDLPPGATHVILEDDEEGQPKVKRERFSLY